LEQLKQGLERRAAGAKSKKTTLASKIAELESLDLGRFELI
jgi:hypothetical protein